MILYLTLGTYEYMIIYNGPESRDITRTSFRIQSQGQGLGLHYKGQGEYMVKAWAVWSWSWSRPGPFDLCFQNGQGQVSSRNFFTRTSAD